MADPVSEISNLFQTVEYSASVAGGRTIRESVYRCTLQYFIDNRTVEAGSEPKCLLCNNSSGNDFPIIFLDDLFGSLHLF